MKNTLRIPLLFLFAACALGLHSGCGKKDPNSNFGETAPHKAVCKLMIEGAPEAYAKERDVLTSQVVFDEVLAKLKLIERWNQETQSPFTQAGAMKALRDSVRIQEIDGTQIISIEVRRPESLEAAEIANEIARVYLANRLLVHGKDAEQQLQAAEAKIAEQQQRVNEARDAVAVFTKPKPATDSADRIAVIAEAKFALDEAKKKLRFVSGVSFEEWPYYTNFDWGDDYAEAIKDLMNANATIEYLNQRLGPDHPRLVQARETRDQLRDSLAPIVDSIKRQSAEEVRAAQATIEALQNEQRKASAPPALSPENTAALKKAQARLNQETATLNALNAAADAIGPEAASAQTKATIVELARP